MPPRLHYPLRLTPLLLTVTLSDAAASTPLAELVITAPAMRDPFTIESDPKTARQPLPAADGAAYLKSIPGFSVSRKGGVDGDPALRGLGGSRLNILLDDTLLLGGCGHRMDPPTAYVYPESYDNISVLKGPQALSYGAAIGGTVRFERNTAPFTEPGWRGTGALVAGSAGRRDQMADVTAGNRHGYLRLIATHAEADDYQAGNGDRVHSAYQRWSGSAIAGWMPTAATRLELSFDSSDGEAAYADRTMDGVQFERRGYALKLQHEAWGEWLERFEVKLYHNQIDHVMDNYSLRPVTLTPMTMPTGMVVDGYRKAVMNPDRVTSGGRLSTQIALGEQSFATVGADLQRDHHRSRTAMSMAMPMMNQPLMLPDDPDYAALPYNDKAAFQRYGLFSEVTHQWRPDRTLVAGFRIDRNRAEAQQQVVMMDDGLYGGAAAGRIDRNTTGSAFVRYQQQSSRHTTLFAGIGQAQRAADFWERERQFDLAPEQSRQIDLGLQHQQQQLQINLALFYATIDDYLLITDNGSSARNIDARHYGGELDWRYHLTPAWQLSGSLAHAHGDNRTDQRPLAQMPPLQGTLAADYQQPHYTLGAVVRMVADQDRIDVGSGTIYGTDIAPTPGFTVVALHTSYQIQPKLQFSAGVDNLFDRNYAEHIGKGSADLGTTTALVNEPGRSYWVRLSGRF